MRGWALVGCLIACGGNHDRPPVQVIDGAIDGPIDAPVDAPVDARPDAAPDAPVTPATCNVLAQTGCQAGEKCTWLHDSSAPPLGHIGCAPDGTVATGGTCQYGADGPTGYDNCTKGSVCVSGACKAVCDVNGGTPMCGTNFACGAYAGLLTTSSGATVAGVCDPTCDPLADNDFFGSGTKTGTACSASQGCYGFPGTSSPTRHSCVTAFNLTLVHRSFCTMANNCGPDATHVYLNGCAQGYIPLLDEQTGSSQAVCIAYCKPADCWLGNCPNNQLRGLSPHDCTGTSARGTFDIASAGGTNGDQCFFSWAFEYDSMGNHIPSPTSDTVGYCIDHSLYKYDSNNNNMLDAGDAVWPRCDTLDISNGFDATFFGCVSTVTATGHGHPPALHPLLADRPRPMYHAIAR